jgi:hypothetical protein
MNLWSQRAVAALAALVTAIGFASCKKETHICPAESPNYVLIASTSSSDLTASQELATKVSAQVIERAVRSCGRIIVGLQDNKPEANLVLQSRKLTPESDKTIDPTPIFRDLREEAQNFVDRNFLRPLKSKSPTNGSPFLGTWVELGKELQAHGWRPATIVEIGDGIEIERLPSGQLVDFRQASVPPSLLKQFLGGLGLLKGSCVMLIGAGSDDAQRRAQIARSQPMLQRTLGKARVGFVGTRSPDVPPRCL